MIQTFKEFQDYIGSLCMYHKLVQHGVGGRRSFFRFDNEEALAAIPNSAASPYVVVSEYKGRVHGEEGEKLQETATLLFLSKAKSQVNGLSNEIERARTEAKGVLNDFISRLQFDYDNDTGCGMLQFLQADQMEYDAIGPVNQLEYGWKLILPFRINTPAYNPLNWTV